MANEDRLHTRRFTFVLTQNESERLERKAVDLGTTMTGALRRSCSDIFDNIEVRQGRIEGISPQRRTG
jgi:hypothetical protein